MLAVEDDKLNVRDNDNALLEVVRGFRRCGKAWKLSCR